MVRPPSGNLAWWTTEKWKRSLSLPHFGLQRISSLESFRSSTASIFSTALLSASSGTETLLSCGRVGRMNI
ncbi:hypothetical protein MRB53_002942 [Persea americana]|uniref:Uncharacterized protein n=1 Tax=Persea americana TaxID=3435 RepID=A0ACC2MXN1_PERAE|nr:hypothetical protein MRB53_002942 [Persea americana]